MSYQVVLMGADDLAALAAEVRAIGADRTIMKELYREVRLWARPAIAQVRDNATAYFPSGGGLNLWVRAGRPVVRIRRGARTADISITAGRHSQGGERSYTRGLDVAGIVRHPVFGDRQKWVSQPVKWRYLTDAVEQHLDEFEQHIDQAIARGFVRVRGGTQ